MNRSGNGCAAGTPVRCRWPAICWCTAMRNGAACRGGIPSWRRRCSTTPSDWGKCRTEFMALAEPHRFQGDGVVDEKAAKSPGRRRKSWADRDQAGAYQQLPHHRHLLWGFHPALQRDHPPCCISTCPPWPDQSPHPQSNASPPPMTLARKSHGPPLMRPATALLSLPGGSLLVSALVQFSMSADSYVIFYRPAFAHGALQQEGGGIIRRQSNLVTSY